MSAVVTVGSRSSPRALRNTFWLPRVSATTEATAARDAVIRRAVRTAAVRDQASGDQHLTRQPIAAGQSESEFRIEADNAIRVEGVVRVVQIGGRGLPLIGRHVVEATRVLPDTQTGDHLPTVRHPLGRREVDTVVFGIEVPVGCRRCCSAAPGTPGSGCTTRPWSQRVARRCRRGRPGTLMVTGVYALGGAARFRTPI